MERARPERNPLRAQSINTELLLDFDTHQQLRSDIIETAAELRYSQAPNAYNIDLQNIKLRGSIPLSMAPYISPAHKRLDFKSFSTDRLSASDDDSTSAIFRLSDGSQRGSVELRTSPEPFEFAGNKQFLEYPHGSDSPTGRIAFCDLAFLLDDLIPDTGRFSALTDPRQDMDFSAAISAVGDLLLPRAKFRYEERS